MTRWGAWLGIFGVCLGEHAALSAQVSPAENTPPKLACAWDPMLEEMAQELVQLKRAPTAAELEQAREKRDTSAIGLKAVWLLGNSPQDVDRWIAQRQAASDAPLNCATATQGKTRLVLAFAKAAELEFFSEKSGLWFRGSLSHGFAKPQLALQSTLGEVYTWTLTEQELLAGWQVPREVEVSKAQLLARGARGVRPVAQLTLSIPAHEVPVSAASSWDWLNNLRQTRAIGKLRLHRILERVATQHAKEICSQEYPAHHSRRGLSPSQRLREAGINAQEVGEVVATARSRQAAQRAILKSPSHVRLVYRRRFTDVGVAEVKCHPKRTGLVMMFARWPQVSVSQPSK